MVKNLAKILLAATLVSLTGCPPAIIPKPELPPIVLPKVGITQGEKKTVNLSYLANDSGITWEVVNSDNPELVNLSLSGDELTLDASDNITEDVSFSGKIIAKRGDKEENISFGGKVENIVDISGNIKNNETGANQAGLVKLFDGVGNKLGEYSTSDGNFSIISSIKSGNTKLQARLNNGYIRTINFSLAGKDISGIEIYAVPHVDFDINDDGTINSGDNQAFIDFMRQINTTPSVDEENGKLVDVSLINKWNLDNLVAIEICRTNSDKGISFSQTSIDNCVSYFADPTNIPKLIAQKKDLNSIIQILENSSSAHKFQPGYITIIPDDGEGTMGGTGRNENFYYINNQMKVNSSLIHLIPTENLMCEPHELAHSFTAQQLWDEDNHTISPKYTLIYSGVEHFWKPGLADEKAGKLLYMGNWDAGEKLEYLLGTKFIDEN
jgi:hypothetical protein